MYYGGVVGGRCQTNTCFKAKFGVSSMPHVALVLDRRWGLTGVVFDIPQLLVDAPKLDGHTTVRIIQIVAQGLERVPDPDQSIAAQQGYHDQDQDKDNLRPQ